MLSKNALRFRTKSVTHRVDETVAAFFECIQYAAEKSGMSDAEALKAVVYFLHGIVEQIVRNKLVRIPGFGMFGTLRHKSYRMGIPGTLLVAFPAWASSYWFRRRVAARVSPHTTKWHTFIRYGKRQGSRLTTMRDVRALLKVKINELK
jgi:hypothetical protein